MIEGLVMTFGDITVAKTLGAQLRAAARPIPEAKGRR